MYKRRPSLPSSRPSTTTTTTKPLIRGKVEFENVNFAYPNRPDVPVLRGVSIKLLPGTVTAIVGPSGAGKTTMTQLLSRFYQPSEGGSIKLDGVDINQIDPSLLTQEISLVGQSPNLFTGSIFYNIAYGAQPDVSPERLKAQVYDAAIRANALQFIESFPDGMETMIGDGGVQLSGGQKQRIAIARAMLKDSKVLILDEATSALDAESESLVQKALENLMAGRTTLVIAHRLNTVIRADNIIVLKVGQVVEQGRHTELMRQGALGHYRSLMATQQTAYLND